MYIKINEENKVIAASTKQYDGFIKVDKEDFDLMSYDYFLNGNEIREVKLNNEPSEDVKKLSAYKNRLNELTKDFAQVQAGFVIPNIAEKQAEFRELLNKVRVIEGKEPRDIIG